MLSEYSLVFFILLVTIIAKTECTYFKNNYGLQNSTRFRRQTNNCQGFQCRTTPECIDIDKECDGVEDCRDGSDEYESICKDFPCPGYLFKCEYGACISATQKCDRKKDCKDGSDEADCPHLIEERINTNCRSDQFECGNGECVSIDGRCDGIADCRDQTDESKDTCFNIYCPGYTYKCAYGACVDSDAKCNGIQNCLDNSDEDNCGPPTVPTPKPITEPSVSIPPPTTKGCVTPKQPQFGQWIYTHNSQKGGKGERVSANTVIRFSCSKGYKLSSTEKDDEYVFCTASGWTFTKMPSCEKVCTPFYSTTTTILKCKSTITGSEVQCDKASNGTVLSFSCAPYYEVPPRSRTVRYCIDGTWDYPKPECIQVCGEKRVSAKPLIVNGLEVERGNYPWVAAIYLLKKGTTNEYTNICGGSMIAQNLIVTAAHCVTNEKGVANDPRSYQVAVGKYYNKYKDPEDLDTAQYSQVEEIIISNQYKGDILHYLGDIALLVMKDIFALSKVAQPICYDGLPYLVIGLGSKGIVNGWGYTQARGQPSNVLKELAIPYKDKNQCIEEFPTDWADKYVTFDKMCGGYLNQNTSVCKGDSGGGLVFKNPSDDRYYIHGIVSVAHSLDKFTCDIQKSALFTMVKEHYDWLDQKIAIKSRRS